ncbi:MAG: gluconate 2-dehydrogenase subunit 3 family protein [Haloplanus sp.]
MNLTRRDALAALATAGAAVGGGALLDGDDPPPAAVPDRALETLVAVAEVVYPDDATGVERFVETYVAGRLDDPDHRAGVLDAVAGLDSTARDWFDAPVTDLDPADRDRLLRHLSVDTADPDPDGTLSGRVRFYVVNELLYAFYASPTGGRLVGIENPVGYPGGTESYQRADMETDG